MSILNVLMAASVLLAPTVPQVKSTPVIQQERPTSPVPSPSALNRFEAFVAERETTIVTDYHEVLSLKNDTGTRSLQLCALSSSKPNRDSAGIVGAITVHIITEAGDETVNIDMSEAERVTAALDGLMERAGHSRFKSHELMVAKYSTRNGAIFGFEQRPNDETGFGEGVQQEFVRIGGCRIDLTDGGLSSIKDAIDEGIKFLDNQSAQ